MITVQPADIFFIITSIAVGILSIILIWGGILIIRTLRIIQQIAISAKKESVTVLRFFHSLGMLFSRSTKKKKKDLN